MPSNHEIVTFHDPPVPPGASPWVPWAQPQPGIEVAEHDPQWRERYQEIAARVRAALGWRVRALQHVGSTAVPGLPAKPIIDVDLIVANPGAEADYVPALEEQGFELRVREPWWFEHRLLRHTGPRANLHVFGYDSPEPIKHRIFRDWLSDNSDDRDLYAAAKHEAAQETNARGEHAMDYNARKEQVIRAIYAHAFMACGLISD